LLLALKNGACNIARLGSGREVKLFGLGTHAVGGLAKAALKVATDLLGFIGLDGARVRLLFCDAYRFECIENGVAFFFQLSCKIVDANFAHSILLVSGVNRADVCSCGA
jgi:hypothetical protein